LVDLGTPRNELSEPIGLEILAGFLRSHLPDIDVTLSSFELFPESQVLSLLNDNTFDLVGISTKIRAFCRLERALKVLRECSLALIVLGDIVATFAFGEVLSRFPEVVCVIGEGEEALLGLVRTLSHCGRIQRSHLYIIPNLAFTDCGSVRTTARSPLNLARLPHPERALLSTVVQRKGIAHVEGSRGCVSSSCAFCGVNHKYGGSPWRPLTVDYIVEELARLSRAGVRSPYFTDEDFLGSEPIRVHRFCRAVADAKTAGRIAPDMNFYFNCRVASVLGEGYGGVKQSRSLFGSLAHIGLREVFLGLESGATQQIARYRKRLSADRSLAALKLLRSLQIDVDLGFICFDPDATLRDLRENVAFIKRAGIDRNYSRLLKKLRLEPFTELGERRQRTLPSAKLDLDSVSYEYAFDDARVAEVYRRFSDWEREDLDIISDIWTQPPYDMIGFSV